MNKNIYMAVGAVVIAGLAFFGGMQYGKSQIGMRQFNRQAGAPGQIAGVNNFTRGGATAGQVLSKDDKSLTVSVTGGGSKIVFLSSATKVMKASDGVIGDVAVGSNVFITGTPNSDGSVTATSIQLR